MMKRSRQIRTENLKKLNLSISILLETARPTNENPFMIQAFLPTEDNFSESESRP